MKQLLVFPVFALLMLPAALDAQALLQSSDGKSSFFNEKIGSLLSLNFSDKSIEFNQTHGPTTSDLRYGLRLKVAALDGYATLFEEGKGFGAGQGELGGYLGWFWQTDNAQRQSGILDLRVYGDVAYSQGSLSLARGSTGGAISRSDSSVSGVRFKAAINSFFGRLTNWMNLSWGLTGSYGNTHNYKYISKLQYCEEVAASGPPPVRLQSCKDGRTAEDFKRVKAWEATADVVFWQPWLREALGTPGAFDVFVRYEEIRPDHPWSWGFGLFLSPVGKPQLPFGGVTIQRFGSDTKLGLQAGVSF